MTVPGARSGGVPAGVAPARSGFGRKPLSGWRICVTRARHQAGHLSAILKAAGAMPIEVPTIEICEPPDGGAALRAALRRVAAGNYAWVVFTSANAVERVFAGLRDARPLVQSQVAAIGEGTESALQSVGIAADLVPERFIAEALAEAFPSTPGGGGAGGGGSGAGRAARRVLLPRAAVAREVLPEGLRRKGWGVDVVEAYRTRRPLLGEDLKDAAAGADAVTFTSSSTVTGFVELIGARRAPRVVACIGPVTAATATAEGMAVVVEAEIHSMEGLVDALASYAARSGRP